MQQKRHTIKRLFGALSLYRVRARRSPHSVRLRVPNTITMIVCLLQLNRKGAKMFQQLFRYCSCLSGSGTNGTSLKTVLMARVK